MRNDIRWSPRIKKSSMGQEACRLNGSNVHETSHSSEAATMAALAEVLTVVIGMGPDLDHNGHWPEALNRALAGHRHELFIDLDAPLQPSAAEELAFHHGYILEIRSQVPISLQAIERLGANPAKRLSLTPRAKMDVSVPNHAPRQWMATLIDSV